jgi:hypothetical protein
MAQTFSLETFGDIYDAIREQLGVQAADTNAVNKIKRAVNMYYLNEVVSFKRWTWLQKNIQIVHGAYYNVDTVSVTPGGTAITFNTSPNSTLGSFTGYKFSVDNSNRVYQIATHVAGSASAVLTSPFQENINATAKYKVWRDRVDLPTNAKETIQITHAEQREPLTALGSQAFRKREAEGPKRENFPFVYNTDTFFDPSGSISEDDRYRQVRLYPSITTSPITLSIDYIEEAVPLVDDADEPIIPLEDRIVLYYGAGAMAWSVLQRNEEMHDKWMMKANAKLSRMAGDRDDGFDTPKITPDSSYIQSQRNAGLRRRRYGFGASTGQSSVSLPSYLKDVIINGGTLTAPLIVSPGVTIGGIDITALAQQEILTTKVLLDNTSNQVVATWSLALYNVVHVDYAITRGTTNIEVGQVKLAGLNTGASIAQGAITNLGDVGVSLSADVSGSSIRLLATTTSTGVQPTITFKVRPWLG